MTPVEPRINSGMLQSSEGFRIVRAVKAVPAVPSPPVPVDVFAAIENPLAVNELCADEPHFMPVTATVMDDPSSDLTGRAKPAGG